MKRTQNEVEKEIEKVRNELSNTPITSPNIGHLMTILVGLGNELKNIQLAEMAQLKKVKER